MIALKGEVLSLVFTKKMIAKIKSKLSPKAKRSIANVLAVFVFYNLKALAKVYKPSKGKVYDFYTLYTKHLKRFRFKKIRLLEIGVGGYEDPERGGASLRMWRSFFPFSRVFAIDINDKSPHEERRIKIFKGSQSDTLFLEKMLAKTGNLDVIIDDGSHFSKDVITSFEYLFPHLNHGGVYVIEDTQTSYWKACGGSMDKQEKTTMNYFKDLVDGINYEEFPVPGYQANYFEKNIVSIHFYHNIIFIKKDKNNKGSNVLTNNVMPS